MKCHGCGIEKDPKVLEYYLYPEDSLITNEPIPPLGTLEVQSDGDRDTDWRAATVCHHCFHRLDPDLWIDQRGWEAINPVTPFQELPLLYGGK